MSKPFIFIFCIIFLIGCSQPENNQTTFVHYLDKGYAKRAKAYDYEPLIFGFQVNRKSTCVYGEKPNETVKTAIDDLYLLIVNELGELAPPLYVKSLSECQKDTSIFVYIYSTLEQPNKHLRKEFETVYQFSETPINTKHKIHWIFNGVGSSHIIHGANGKMFVEINQLNKLIKQDEAYKKVAKTIALEELYHAISGGDDLHFSKKMMSKLNEPSLKANYSRIKQKEPTIFTVNSIGKNQYKIYFKNYILELKPQSLCSFDLWFLLLADQMKDKKTVKYNNYVRVFNSEYKQIQQRALSIEKSPKYKALFDPRCSGVNVGLNTKIISN